VPIIKNDETKAIPFRDGYRLHQLAGAAQGLRCAVSISVVEPGAGAPLHVHPDVDEVLVVVAGTLDVRLGDERCQVGPDHTLAIPRGVPHAFTAITPARVLGFLPALNAIASTTYLEGEPPRLS
jgi:mannose-6-phosphate isomerase-like protein (cupin superfamily)